MILNNLQALRAFAAINVVYYHIFGIATKYNQPIDILSFLRPWSNNGVDIFFVISGFVMVYTQFTNPKTCFEFIRTRFLRIVPIYWILTSFALLAKFVLLATAVNQNLFTEINSPFSYVVASYFFLAQALFHEKPIIHIGWTLEWEMLFYILFGIGLLFKSPKFSLFFPIIFLLGLALFFNHLVVLEFILGMMSALLFLNKTIHARYGIIILLFGVSLLSMSLFIDMHTVNAFYKFGIPAFFIVYGTLLIKQTENPLVILLGNASYSIYLIQFFTLPAYYKFSTKILYNINYDLNSYICLLTTVLLGILMHLWLEKPLTNFLRKI